MEEKTKKISQTLTQEQLRLIHGQSKAILNSIPDIAWLKDKDSRFIVVNEAFGKACGLKPEELTGKTDLDIWPRDLAERYRADDQEVMRNKQRKRVEEPLADKKGKIQWIETIKTPIFNEQGDIIGTSGIARDITERKMIEGRLKDTHGELEIRVKVRTAELTKANEDLLRENIERKRIEDLLKESEARYRCIVEDQTELICRFLSNGIISFVNESYCRYFGKKKEDLIGKTFMPLIPPDDRKKVEENLRSLSVDNPVMTHEHRVISPGGAIRWQQWTNHAIFDSAGNLVELQAVGRDITDRKGAEETLREKERFLHSVFASIQDGISILDKDMNIVRVNATMESWYAHSMPLVGRKCYVAYHSRNKPCDVCPTRETIKSGKAAYEIVPKRGGDGEINGWLDLFSFPLFDQDTGELKGAIEYVRDISGRIKAEQEREELNKELDLTNKRLKQIALLDSQTGLYNHRYLDKVIEAEFHRAKRYANSLAVIMLDIDYFKSINDVYGFDFGDLIIKQFSKQLKRIVRKYDVVIRFGGEEFIILSPGSGRPEAVNLAQRILDALCLYTFGDKKHKVKLKLSLAAVAFPEDKISKGMDLINLADKIINKAKEFGGNRVYSSLDIKKGSELKKAVVTDVKLLKGKIDRLTKKANQSLVEAIFAFAKTIELKDHYTGEHVESTVRYATDIARALNLAKEEIELVKQAAMLHDLGKIGISENILLKKSKLTKKEYNEIKRHPQIGADIIRPIQYLRGIIPYIFYHHERWDGKGYPSGIKGDEIPIGARIIAIADVFQALTSDRPYRKAYSYETAVKIMKSGAGTQFDPKIVDVFLKLLQR